MTQLNGMAEICKKVKRSPATVLMLYRTAGFPMVKVGGLWESSEEDIDAWRTKVIRQDIEKRKNDAGRSI